MKTYLVVLSVLSLGSLWLSTANAKPVPTHREPFALVELFTSEGCSSCPPADRVLQALHRDRAGAGERVYVLSFHVDYWNRLGWVDPFSDAAYSDRQRAYARAFRSRTVYTPQMVVNGRDEFVGSRAKQASDTVDHALQATPRPEVGVGFKVGLDAEGSAASVDWRLDRLPDGVVLNVAVVEDGLTVEVPRGENHGRTLTHDGVVRAWQTISLDAKYGQVTLDLPSDLDASRSAVIAFVQDRKTMQVLGAHREALSGK